MKPQAYSTIAQHTCSQSHLLQFHGSNLLLALNNNNNKLLNNNNNNILKEKRMKRLFPNGYRNAGICDYKCSRQAYTACQIEHHCSDLQAHTTTSQGLLGTSPWHLLSMGLLSHDEMQYFNPLVPRPFLEGQTFFSNFRRRIEGGKN